MGLNHESDLDEVWTDAGQLPSTCELLVDVIAVIELYRVDVLV